MTQHFQCNQFSPDTSCKKMEAIGIGHSKCLLLGGYLVLDRSNTCLVISLSPKVKCVGILEDGNFSIRVITNPSGQTFDFIESDWSDTNQFAGKFERFILASFHVFFSVYPLPQRRISLSINGDSEFYTENGKTGLGSSSATTVAVTQCLFNLLQPNLEDLDTHVFKFAAVAHSIAQGNVGSCFDISCSVWGSQIFRRPSPSLISIDKLNQPWDNEHTPFSLPNNINCLLLSTPFDGSSTSKLVKKFNSKSIENTDLYNRFRNTVQSALDALSQGNKQKIKVNFLNVKEILREITIKCDVDIVPKQVYDISSKIEQIEGVIASVIPGAGGYDSLAVISELSFIDFSSVGLKIIAKYI